MSELATAPKPKKGRVLCVDDEPNILRSLQWLLQRDFEVTTAPSGAAALERVRNGDFDVVVSDQRMPGMTGSELLREVRKLSPRSMRILLTGYSDMQALLRSVNESEVFRFINKPWNTSELPQVVEQAANIARGHAAEVPAANDDALPDADRTESVLVIDDDPAVARQLIEVMGPNQRIVHAHDLGEALRALDDDGGVGIIVSDTHAGGADTTVLLKLLKRDHPAIVSIVYASATDAVDLVTLINHGQIFRFLPKPVKPTMLRMALNAALHKRARLKANPDIAARHVVQALPHEHEQALLSKLEAAAPTANGAAAGSGSALLQRLRGSLRRLFSIA